MADDNYIPEYLTKDLAREIYLNLLGKLHKMKKTKISNNQKIYSISSGNPWLSDLYIVLLRKEGLLSEEKYGTDYRGSGITACTSETYEANLDINGLLDIANGRTKTRLEKDFDQAQRPEGCLSVKYSALSRIKAR